MEEEEEEEKVEEEEEELELSLYRSSISLCLRATNLSTEIVLGSNGQILHIYGSRLCNSFLGHLYFGAIRNIALIRGRAYSNALCARGPMFVCVGLCVCIYACMYVCMHACMHVCMYVVAYIWEGNMGRCLTPSGRRLILSGCNNL